MNSQLQAAESADSLRLSAFKRELEANGEKVCLSRGWLQNAVLLGCVCVCLTGLAGKAISAPVNGLQGEAPQQESGTLSDEYSLSLYDGGLAGKQGRSQMGVSVLKY